MIFFSITQYLHVSVMHQAFLFFPPSHHKSARRCRMTWMPALNSLCKSKFPPVFDAYSLRIRLEINNSTSVPVLEDKLEMKNKSSECRKVLNDPKNASWISSSIATFVLKVRSGAAESRSTSVKFHCLFSHVTVTCSDWPTWCEHHHIG